MSPWWGDLAARARGLTARLPGADAVRDAREAGGVAGVLELLGSSLPEVEPGSPAGTTEVAVTRALHDRLSLLRRWAAGRTPRLAVIFEEADRTAVRVLLRGAAGGTPAESRLEHLRPTAHLSPGALQALASAATPREMVEELTRREHPFAPYLASTSSGMADPAGGGTTAGDLFELELAVDRAYLTRSRESAGRAQGDLCAFVARSVDLSNCWSALSLAGEEREVPPETLFLDGGADLDPVGFRHAAGAGSADEAADLLAEALEGSPLRSLLREAGASPRELEGRALALQVRRTRRAARRRPVGPAPVLLYWLRLRALVHDLRSLAWGRAMDAPDELVARQLVSIR